ncbi:MAG: PEP-CTERM sorting domain-containing protein [Planctomycetota bacterium]
MKTYLSTRSMIAATLACLSTATAQAAVTFNNTSGADPGSATITVTDLDSTPPSENATGFVFTATGSFTSVNELSDTDSFTITIDATKGWSSTDADNAANFGTYIDGLFGTANLGLGTIAGGNFAPQDGGGDTLFANGEALVLSFNTDNLTTTGAALSFVQFGQVGLTGGTDQVDFYIWDSDTNTIVQATKNDNVDNGVPVVSHSLTTGDLVVLAGLNTNGFRVDNLQFDITGAVPEPGSLALLALAAGMTFSRRRQRD